MSDTGANMKLKLKCIGTMLLGVPYHAENNPYLWNIECPGHPYHGSSVALQTWKALIKGGR